MRTRNTTKTSPHRFPLHPSSPFILAALLFLTAPAGTVEAQAPDWDRVVVAIPDSFPPLDAPALLVRTPDRDIVLLQRVHAEPETLGAALMLLATLQTREVAPRTGQVVPISGFAWDARLDDERVDHLDGVLHQLRNQPTRPVGNLGPGQWIRYTAR